MIIHVTNLQLYKTIVEQYAARRCL